MKLVCLDADGLAYINGSPWQLVPIHPSSQQLEDFPVASVAEDVYDRMLARAPKPSQDPEWHTCSERQPPEDAPLLALQERNLDATILPAVFRHGRYICEATRETLETVIAWRRLPGRQAYGKEAT